MASCFSNRVPYFAGGKHRIDGGKDHPRNGDDSAFLATTLGNLLVLSGIVGRSLQAIKNRLKAINKEYLDEYNHAVELARRQKLGSLRSGDKVPEINLADGSQDLQDAFAAKVESFRNRVAGVLDAALKEVEEIKAEAPSTDAVNAVTMLRGKRNVTQSEIDALLKTYGDNYLTHTALADLAAQHGLYEYNRHMVLDIEDGLRELARIYKRDMTAAGAAHASISPARAAVVDLSVDMNLPW